MSILEFLSNLFIPTSQNPNFTPQTEVEPTIEMPPTTLGTPKLAGDDSSHIEVTSNTTALPETILLPQTAVSTPPLNSPLRMIGDITCKYESGKKGSAAISSGVGDPGGVSYGKYQLASKIGVVQDFIKKEGYANSFAGLQAGTQAFNTKWLSFCNDSLFVASQWSYIYSTHYAAVRQWCDNHQIISTRRVNESLWSMAVQHGRTIQIVQLAAITGNNNETDVITRLYHARRVYVQNLSSLPMALKNSLMKRYDVELADVLAMPE